MNLDTLARRAADGVRASTGGLDPMAQITALKREDHSRRRTARASAVLGGVLVAAFAGWLAVGSLGGSGGARPQPMSSPTVLASPSVLPMGVHVPAGWSVICDDRSVLLAAGPAESPTGPSVRVGGPVLKVWDPKQDAGTDLPASGYARWLLRHPSLALVGSTTVRIDGSRARQLTFRVDGNASGAGESDRVRLGRYEGCGMAHYWDEMEPGTRFTETVLEINRQTMVVKAYGADTAGEQAEQDAALDLVLSTLRLPN